MKRILYLECNSGISGDMTVGTLLDLGADQKFLMDTLESLKIDGYHISIGKKKKCDIEGTDFDVILENENHDHSHDHHHEHDHDHHEHDHDHHHEHDHHEHHDQDHHHDHDHHSAQGHIHRNLGDIYEIIDMIENKEIVDLAKKMFVIVADAESKAHGIPREEVHFHEVGAIDSIVDIVAAATCIVNLGIEDVVIKSLSEGTGTVKCAHGIMPVPCPATLNIAQANGLKLKITEAKGEMVTPTGAAIAAAIKTNKELPENYTIERVGIGTGKKDFPHANILRSMILNIEEDTQKTATKVIKLEANIDDATGEALGYVMNKLFESGALDVYYIPVFMKKNRPGTLLSVLCKKEDKQQLEKIIFTHTTTIGIRYIEYGRTVLDREDLVMQTDIGVLRAKKTEGHGVVNIYPEYDSIIEVAEHENISFQDAYQYIQKQFKK